MEQELPVGNQTVSEAPVEALMSQKDAVFLYTTEVLVSMNQTLDDRVKRVLKSSKKDLPDDEKRLAAEIKKQVRAKLHVGFTTKKVKLGSEKSSQELTKYCSGLVNHWFKRDERFN